MVGAFELGVQRPKDRARLPKSCRKAFDGLERALNCFEVELFRSLGILFI
jgi:hypothetical protein